MNELLPWEMENTVSAYATTLGGVICLLLWLVLDRRGVSWLLVYLAMVLTGVATIFYHGYGETFELGTADIGTNLLLIWLIQVAVLGDHHRRLRPVLAGLTGAAIATYVVARLVVGEAIRRVLFLSLGPSGGFSLGEMLLIGNTLAAFVFLWAAVRRLTRRRRALLVTFTGVYAVGVAFATQANDVVAARIVPFHAIWHIIAGFGFVLLWAFNHVPLVPEADAPGGQ